MISIILKLSGCLDVDPQIGAAAEEKAKAATKGATKDFVMDASNPLFAAAGGAATTDNIDTEGTQSSTGSGMLSKSQRAALVLGRASTQKNLRGRGRGKK